MLFSTLKKSSGVMMGGSSKNKLSGVFILLIYFSIALFINALLVNLTYNQIAPKIFQSSQQLNYWDSMMLVILAMVLFH